LRTRSFTEKTRAAFVFPCLLMPTEIAVSDLGDGLPSRRAPSPGVAGGFGLNLVANLTAGWGVTPKSSGKEVWARVRHGDTTLVRSDVPGLPV